MTAVVLLVLTGHAFVVSASHFHRGWQPSATAEVAAAGARVVAPQSAQPSPLADGHEQCLLCRLQRHLVADLQHAGPTLGAPRAEALDPDRLAGPHLLSASPHAPPGRAPPSL